NILGVNITIPHKEAVIPFLDGLSEEAGLIGAVNTIVNEDGRLIGYNTDGEGYVRSLKREVGFDIKDKMVLILGAGGAARGILVGIVRCSPKGVIVANRTVERAKVLVEGLKGHFPLVELIAIGLIPEALRDYLGKVDLLINATSLGMRGEGMGLPLDVFPKGAVVSDIVYKPPCLPKAGRQAKTPLLQEAEERGLTTHGGLGMLVEQGALSFKLWTGLDVSTEVMRKAMRQIS
ncbi:MAG: shikimate dehydrogenase, partial [Deltaproteobacteria bacterium]|nr:shikimate dehydrogenase [Deltaproteobacteria bacterium]